VVSLFRGAGDLPVLEISSAPLFLKNLLRLADLVPILSVNGYQDFPIGITFDFFLYGADDHQQRNFSSLQPWRPITQYLAPRKTPWDVPVLMPAFLGKGNERQIGFLPKSEFLPSLKTDQT
jgi:hypothetical protein